MQREQVVQKLSELLSVLKQNYHVNSIGVFGSVARDQATPKSDLDILVSFSNKPTYDTYIELKLFLEATFKAKVDLVTEASLDERIKPYIQEDLIRVA